MDANRHCGLSLLELIIAISILAILLSISAPSLSNIISKSELSATTDLIRATVALTRGEAIKRGHRVAACLGGNALQCNPADPRSLIVFNDSDRSSNPTHQRDIIRILRIDVEKVKVSYNRPLLAFSATGTSAGTNGTFTICHRNRQGRMLVISTLGRVREAVDYDGDGLVEKTPGNPVNC
ncbi:GspH/FimT family protein [Marinobacter nauticus]|uniref:Type II secretion system protein H n=1 Tax=Marinobacter nauticus TaxID=2743 RepID=A0A368USL2_MARNT|nr:type IV fimbrial biogenesis protein FimT [Marinobacter nauticus]RCW31762.1 type IV fimbrial biogenesis protein FimT [Marinobacter nauticus]